MLQHEILQRKSLFYLLHILDVDLAESTRQDGCPTVGGHCIKRLTLVSPGAAPRTFLKIILSA
jgi:hypothetical protein